LCAGVSVALTSVSLLHAWQIGPNDVERSALRDNCDPIIPIGVANAPVLEVLRQNRDRKRPMSPKGSGKTRRKKNPRKKK